MNFVEPIRDVDVFHDIQATLRKEKQRNYALIMTGTYTGLRISDILRLKVQDVKDKKYIDVKEKKTTKRNIIEINPILRKVYGDYCHEMNEEEYLFRKTSINKPIGRGQAWKIMKDIGDRFGIENLGTHTLRKTFGFHYYKQTGDIATLMYLVTGLTVGKAAVCQLWHNGIAIMSDIRADEYALGVIGFSFSLAQKINVADTLHLAIRHNGTAANVVSANLQAFNLITAEN